MVIPPQLFRLIAKLSSAVALINWQIVDPRVEPFFRLGESSAVLVAILIGNDNPLINPSLTFTFSFACRPPLLSRVRAAVPACKSIGFSRRYKTRLRVRQVSKLVARRIANFDVRRSLCVNEVARPP